jgi:hypothetical protein
LVGRFVYWGIEYSLLESYILVFLSQFWLYLGIIAPYLIYLITCTRIPPLSPLLSSICIFPKLAVSFGLVFVRHYDELTLFYTYHVGTFKTLFLFNLVHVTLSYFFIGPGNLIGLIVQAKVVREEQRNK